jgi:hypothetical protein
MANLTAGVALIAAGLLAWLWLIPGYVVGANTDHGTIGQGFMPRVASAAMALFGIMIVSSALFHLKRGDLDGDSHEDSEENEYLVFGRSEIINVVILALICTAYTLLLKWIGFAAASTLLLLLLIHATGFRNLPVTLAVAILLPLGLQELLWRVLQIPLPEFPRVLF